jgi:hypothetical protein
MSYLRKAFATQQTLPDLRTRTLNVSHGKLPKSSILTSSFSGRKLDPVSTMTFVASAVSRLDIHSEISSAAFSEEPQGIPEVIGSMSWPMLGPGLGFGVDLTPRPKPIRAIKAMTTGRNRRIKHQCNDLEAQFKGERGESPYV